MPRPVRAYTNDMDAAPKAPNIEHRAWRWFVAHAQSRYSLVWLAAVSFADAIFFPIAPEIFLVALMLANPPRWKLYLPIALASSVLGAAVAYFIAHAVFHQFVEPVLAFYGAQSTFMYVQRVIHGHVFLTMMLGNFAPIPDKALIYAGGFLGVKFVPFILGYFVGRGVRMSVATYLAGRYGTYALTILRRYFAVVAVVLVVLGTIYAMVHWHLLGF